MSGWALRLEACEPARLTGRLGPLRLRPGVETCADATGCTWVRGPSGERADERLDVLLRSVAGAEHFEVGSDGDVRAPGRRLPPSGVRLPRGPWRPLSAILTPVATATATAHVALAPPARVTLRLERAPGPPAGADAPGALLVSRDVFVEWALAAPQVRLDPLEVAARAPGDGRAEVVVRGRPLPPLPGVRFVLAEGVAVPSGLCVRPALDATTLRALLALGPGDLALLGLPPGEAGPAVAAGPAVVERVEAVWFAPASRAVARALRGPA